MRKLLNIFALTTLIFLASVTNLFANPSYEFKVQAGTLTVESFEPENAMGYQALLLNKKNIKKGKSDILSLSLPVRIGKLDVFAVGENCSGSGCGDKSDTQIYLMEASGKFTIAPVTNMQGKKEESFYCEWGDDSPAKLISEKWIFQCIERDGRRTKTTYWTLDKGIVRESRSSTLWGTVK